MSISVPITDAAEQDPSFEAVTPGRQWWLAGTLAVFALISSIDRHVIALLVDEIKGDLRLDDTQISLLLGAAFAVSYTLAALPAGYLADRFSRKGVVGGAVALWSIMTIMCGGANSYGQLFAARAGVGIGEGTLVPASVSMIRDGISPSRRGRAFSMITATPLAGMGLSMLLGGFLVAMIEARGGLTVPIVGHLAPWQVALVTLGLVGLPLSLAAATLYEPARTGTPAQDLVSRETYQSALRFVSGNKRLFVPLFIVAIANTILSSSFGAWVPSVLRRSFGLTPAEIGAHFGTMILFAAPLGLFVAGYLIDRMREGGRMIAPGYAALGGSLVVGTTATLVPIMPNTAVMWPIFAIQLLSSGIPFAAVQLTIANATPSRLTGKVAALNVLLMALLGQAVGPTIVAATGTLFSGPQALATGLSITAAVAGLVAVIASIYLLRAMRTTRNALA